LAKIIASTDAGGQLALPHLEMPTHHDIRAGDIVAKRLYGNLAAAADRGPRAPARQCRKIKTDRLGSELRPPQSTKAEKLHWPLKQPNQLFNRAIALCRNAG
jgi:hypothetical protein